ncbi:MAG: 7-carboxy-7-deazaguanine synthase [Candidimonas sp.]|jgi:7-carboxy-7-deazaguanine synthase
MSYSIKEIFYTLQGEGLQIGKPAVFCRFAGCNLWTGREQDRGTAVCQFCDTDFVGVDGTLGGKFGSADALARLIEAQWPQSDVAHRLVVLTGGEPLLQVDAPLIDALHRRRFKIAVETNGSIAAPPGLDWICVSPKAGAPLMQTAGNELKLVFPQARLMPNDLDADALDFEHWLLQPMDGPRVEENIQAAIAYCQAHPKWRLSIQSHKIVGIR